MIEKAMNETIQNSSITAKNHIALLENLIEISRQTDFSEQQVSGDLYDQAHQGMLMMTFAEEALNQIKMQLGYLPRREVTLPSEPAIRQLLYDYLFKHNDINILFDSCNIILDEVYARDMEAHAIEDYPDQIYCLYDTLYPEYKSAARLRVTQLFNHEPNLKHSIYAELLLRCRMAEIGFAVWEGRIDADYEAEAIIWYRKSTLV